MPAFWNVRKYAGWLADTCIQPHTVIKEKIHAFPQISHCYRIPSTNCICLIFVTFSLICGYVCMYIHVCMCMYYTASLCSLIRCTHTHTHTHMYARMYYTASLCSLFRCMYVCTYIHIIYYTASLCSLFRCMYVCTYIHMYKILHSQSM